MQANMHLFMHMLVKRDVHHYSLTFVYFVALSLIHLLMKQRNCTVLYYLYSPPCFHCPLSCHCQQPLPSWGDTTYKGKQSDSPKSMAPLSLSELSQNISHDLKILVSTWMDTSLRFQKQKSQEAIQCLQMVFLIFIFHYQQLF